MNKAKNYVVKNPQTAIIAGAYMLSQTKENAKDCSIQPQTANLIGRNLIKSNPNQLVDNHGQWIDYNKTHSWYRSPLQPFYDSLDKKSQTYVNWDDTTGTEGTNSTNFESDKEFREKWTNEKEKLESIIINNEEIITNLTQQLNIRPNITNTEYEELIAKVAALTNQTQNLNEEIKNKEDNNINYQQKNQELETELAKLNKEITDKQAQTSASEQETINQSQHQPKNQAGYINPITAGGVAATAGYLFGKRSKTELEDKLNQTRTDYQNEQREHQQTKVERDNYQQSYQAEKTQTNNLQNWKDNHNCPACPLIHYPTSHTCPDCQVSEHKDYDTIKNERNYYQNKLENINKKLNSELKLGLTGEFDLDEIISRVKELIDKPDNIEELKVLKQIIVDLEKQLSDDNILFQKLSPAIGQSDLKMLQELGITVPPQLKSQFEQATNYQELSQVKQAIIQQHLAQNNTDLSVISGQKKQLIQHQQSERIILISLLVASLLVIGGLVVKLKRRGKKNLVNNS